MLLKHANQYALKSVRVLCPTVLADIAFDVLKLVNLMSMTDNALGRHERRRLVLWMHYWEKIRCRHERDSCNSWGVDKATVSRRLHEMEKIWMLGNGYHMNSPNTELPSV
uniref:Helix-turn-helix domain-containing protein n=1 Tax=Heterorhabditis bacteriophora TaxID=37862 RepID=A0A1I7XIC0_HETBA